MPNFVAVVSEILRKKKNKLTKAEISSSKSASAIMLRGQRLQMTSFPDSPPTTATPSAVKIKKHVFCLFIVMPAFSSSFSLYQILQNISRKMQYHKKRFYVYLFNQAIPCSVGL